MKKLSITLLLIITLLGGSFFIAPVLIPKDVVAERVKSKVRDLTGRDITFQDVNVTFWPNIGLELSGVKFSNPEWAEYEYLMWLSKLEVSVAVKPLLEKRVEVKKFTLINPVINLEIGKDDQKTWLFDVAKKSTPVKTEKDGVVSGLSDDLSRDLDFKFGQVIIKNGQLNFFNHKTLARENISGLNTNIDWPDLNNSLKLKSDLRYNNKRLALNMSLLKPLDFIKGRSSSGNIILKADDLSFKANGLFSTSGEFLNGSVGANIKSLPAVVAWLSGKDLKASKDIPFENISFDSSLAASATDLILKDANLKLDDISAMGNLSLDFSAKPDIFARLSVSELNLDKFIKPEGSVASSNSSAMVGNRNKSWDSKPIDLSKLNIANLDLGLKTKGFSLKGVNVGPSDLTVIVKNGNLDFKSSKASLFGGKFSSNLKVNSSKKTPTMALDFDMSGVKAKPILKTFAGFDKISGLADTKVSVTSSGRSQKDIISSLNGKGFVTFKNGSFEGIDLVRISKLIQSNISTVNVGDGKTDFVEVGGNFSISKGVVRNDDLKMTGPSVKATGKGSIDLPNKYIKYRVTPVLVSNVKNAAGSVVEADGLSIPVDIKGGFDYIKVIPDFKSVIRDSMTDPNKAKANVKDIKSKVKTLRENIKKDPVNALDAIFGSGLFGVPK